MDKIFAAEHQDGRLTIANRPIRETKAKSLELEIEPEHKKDLLEGKIELRKEKNNIVMREVVDRNINKQ